MKVMNAGGEQVNVIDAGEAEAAGEFDELLNAGNTIAEAIDQVRRSYPLLSDEFMDWLGC